MTFRRFCLSLVTVCLAAVAGCGGADNSHVSQSSGNRPSLSGGAPANDTRPNFLNDGGTLDKTGTNTPSGAGTPIDTGAPNDAAGPNGTLAPRDTATPIDAGIPQDGGAPDKTGVNAPRQPSAPQAGGQQPAPTYEAAKKIAVFQHDSGRMGMSADGKLLVLSGADDAESVGKVLVRVYDLAAGKSIRDFSTESAGIVSVAISPDGTLVAFVGPDYSIQVASVKTGEVLRSLPEWDVDQIDFSADGKSVWSNVDSKLVQWSVENGQVLRELTAEGVTVTRFRLFPDATKVAVGYRNGGVRVWDLATNQPAVLAEGALPEPPLADIAPDKVLGIDVSRDGRLLASARIDHDPRLWNVESRKLLHEMHSGGGLRNDSVAVHPSGKFVVCQGDWLTSDGVVEIEREGWPLQVFDAATGKRLAFLNLPGTWLGDGLVWDMAWSPDGASLYAALSNGTVHVFDVSRWGAAK